MNKKSNVWEQIVRSSTEQKKVAEASTGFSFVLPKSLQEKVVPQALSLSSLFTYSAKKHTEMLFTEILFMYCSPQRRWRFMGVSFNKTNGRTVEELASSIFREDPTQEIDAPWSCIYAFCETAMCVAKERKAPPFVRLAHLEPPHHYMFLPLREFAYQTRSWSFDVHPLSRLA